MIRKFLVSVILFIVLCVVALNTLDYFFEPPLVRYADKEHKKEFLELLSKGADVNETGWLGITPLTAASRDCSGDIIQIALDHKADINHAESDGNTALLAAARHCGVAIVKLLLDHGADIHSVDHDGRSALTLAAKWDNRTDVLKLLIDRGADIDTKDHIGYSALQWARFERDDDNIKLLKDRGAK